MKAIVNVNLDWAIGKNNMLINRFSEDMNFFKQKTLENTIVYGRKTLESFPKKAPLSNRTNIVLTSDVSSINPNSIKACDSYIEVKEDISKYTKTKSYEETVEVVKNMFDNRRYGITSLISTDNIKNIIALSNIASDFYNEIYICGGESIYRQMIKYCDTVYVTMCYNHCEGADAFFPCLNMLKDWEISDRSGLLRSSNNIDFEFITYERLPKTISFSN